jgi:hypothetical protein
MDLVDRVCSSGPEANFEERKGLHSWPRVIRGKGKDMIWASLFHSLSAHGPPAPFSKAGPGWLQTLARPQIKRGKQQVNVLRNSIWSIIILLLGVGACAHQGHILVQYDDACLQVASTNSMDICMYGL